MQSNFREMVMEPRPDWNAIGPRLPAWFRLRLSRIDRNLVLQFIPPRGTNGDGKGRGGVDSGQFPEGVWVICRLLRGTGWLLKRWIWSLSDQYGRYQEPGADTIEMLRTARDLWRRDAGEVMEREMEEAIEAVKSDRVRNSREHLKEYLEQLCRVHQFVRRHSRVFMRQAI